MLSERQLEAMLDVFRQRMQGVTEDYLNRMGQHLKDIGRLTASDINRIVQLKRLNYNIEQIKREIAASANKSADDIDRVFETVAEEDLRFAAEVFAADHTPAIKDNPAIERILKAQAKITQQTLKNLSQTTLLSDSYRDAVDIAIQAAQSGVTDYNSAIRSALKTAAQDGLRVRYPNSGISRRLDSAVRMNVLDGIRAINQDVMHQVGKEFGADGIEISAHALCAEDHLPYQGMQMSNKEFDRLQNRLDRPFGMWNCRHSWYPILLGISKPAYRLEELAEFKRSSREEITIDDRTKTRYEWTQEQRRVETALRYQKDIAIAAKASGDDYLRRTTQRNINTLNSYYTKIIDAAGLYRDTNRMAVAGFRKVKTVSELKSADNNGIIESIKNHIRSSDVIKTINPEKQNRHIKGEKEYIDGRSYINGDINTAQALVNTYHGTGTPMIDKNGKWRNKEVVKVKTDIGMNVDNHTNSEESTNRFVIHYSKTGTHIVPTSREE